MVDLEVDKMAYQHNEMEQIGFIRSEHNIADCLTKSNGNDALVKTLKFANINHPVDQWIDRSHTGGMSRHK